MAGYYNITNRSFRDASAYLRHQLSDSFRLPPTNLPTLPTNQSPSFLSHFSSHFIITTFTNRHSPVWAPGLGSTPFPGRQGVPIHGVRLLLRRSFLFLCFVSGVCSVHVSLFWLSLSASVIDCPERLPNDLLCQILHTHSLTQPSVLPSFIRG